MLVWTFSVLGGAARVSRTVRANVCAGRAVPMAGGILQRSEHRPVMQLSSVNLGSRQTQPKGPELEITGIYKRAAPGVVRIESAGVVGDFIGDSNHHGGPDQAVYLYGNEDYGWWSEQLGRRLSPGTFGENLTISGLAVSSLNIGDRLRVGAVVLEVTDPRIPCSTLARRMGDFKFTVTFRDAERPGAYCRVLQPGDVEAGTDVAVEQRLERTLSILEMFRLHYRRDKDEYTLRQMLAAPVSIRSRRDLEKELQGLISGGMS